MNMYQPLEGYIKFNCNLVNERIEIPTELFHPLNFWRTLLWNKGLIGAYPDGIGFGNVSIRTPGTDQFYISGTATGCLSKLEMAHYSLVERCEPDFNTIWCRGLIKASAESMSHSAIYASLSNAGAVVHVHNRMLWNQYLGILPTTSSNVKYGTPAMASEIIKIISLPETLSKRVFVMGGHEEGIIAFGKTVKEASLVLLELGK